MENPVNKTYGNRVRTRTCGICIIGDGLVMVNHKMPDGDLWAPPGGGMEFGEDAQTCLAREFREETGLLVDVGPFLFAYELIKPPLHAVELFFHVIYKGGDLRVGDDPETAGDQIIKEVKLLTSGEIRTLGADRVHRILAKYPDISQITALRGYFRL